MKVLIDEMAVEYDRIGAGKVLVLLHGWGDSKETYTRLISALESSYDVVSVDLPGFGKSEAPKVSLTLETFAVFVQRFLQKIGVDEVYAYIGHSHGGAIIIKGLSMGILTCDKAVLLASSGIRSEYKAGKKLMRMAVKTAKIPTKLLPKRTQKKLRSKVYQKLGSDMLVAEHMQETFKHVVTEDLLADAAMISQKCLLVYGTEDTATPLRYGEMYARQIEHAQLVTLEGADHFLHHTHSSDIERLVKDFLQ